MNDAKLRYKKDIELIMSRINHNGGDLWATIDNKVGKGTPFSTRDVSIMLIDLGFTKNDKIIRDIAELFFSLQKNDGRFKISPSGAIYPCHTIGIVRALCNLGYHDDSRLKKSFDYLLDTQQNDGGWKCNKFIFGRGADTVYSNPGPTLEALEAFRFIPEYRNDNRINRAIEFLLWHWGIKRPIGPCQYGIGSLFKKIEFPFLRYNIFHFCYTLSFYKSATLDKRFNEAVLTLYNILINGEIIIENPNKKLKEFEFCKKGQPGYLATIKYNEMIENIT